MSAFFLIAFLLGLYFLPTILAMGARNNQAPAIFILNLFLGWTFLGWLAALVWAAVQPRKVYVERDRR